MAVVERDAVAGGHQLVDVLGAQGAVDLAQGGGIGRSALDRRVEQLAQAAAHLAQATQELVCEGWIVRRAGQQLIERLAVKQVVLL